MATGYGPQMHNDSGEITSYIRYYYSTFYDAATNTSTVTLTPQLYADLNWGNDIRMYGGSSNAGIRVDQSTLWPFTDGYSGSRHLYCTDCDWNNMYANTGATFSFKKTHDNSGNLSFRAGIVGTISGYGPKNSVYDWPTGYEISVHENRSLYVSYNANGGSGAPSATYFYGSTESITLSSTRPTRTGYTFLGWSTSSTATTATYSPGQNIGTRSSGLTLYAVWEKKTFELSISEGTGSQITVEKQGTVLSDGSTITQGDTLIVKVSPMIGYDIAGLTVNGTAITSGDSYKVSSDVTVESSATVKQFSLTKSEGTGTIITVTRTYSPLGKAALEELSDGSTLYHSDVISIAVLTTAGYILQTATMNGGSVQTPYSVSDNVVLTATAIAAGAYIRGNSSFDMYQMLIKAQQAWDLYRPVVYNGTSWENY